MPKRGGNQNQRGVTPPQQGRIAPVPSKPMQVRAGMAPASSVAQFPAMTKVRGGTPPPDSSTSPRSASNVPETGTRGGTSPFQGKIIKGAPMSNAAAGSPPAVNANKPGAGKAPSDIEQNYMDTGRRYAKGGMVAEERNESKAERAREAKNPALEAAEGRHAAGGKVNRHGNDGRVPMPSMAPSQSAPMVGGNGGLQGGNAPIPLAQPGGTPSTGVTSSGSMVPSFAGADTNGITPDGGGKLRVAAVKRAGGMPSLPRPRR